MIAAGIENGVEAPWEAIHSTYKRMMGRAKDEPGSVAEELKLLADELFSLLENAHEQGKNERQ